MKVEINHVENKELDMQYKIYCMQFLTMDIDEIIDTKFLTYEEFCKKYKEEKRN